MKTGIELMIYLMIHFLKLLKWQEVLIHIIGEVSKMIYPLHQLMHFLAMKKIKKDITFLLKLLSTASTILFTKPYMKILWEMQLNV